MDGSAACIRYYGWSAIGIESGGRTLLCDPFYRRYCGVQWFDLADFTGADVICVTHGHEEHFLDVPVIAHAGEATIVGSPALTRFLARRHRLPVTRLRPLDPHTFGRVLLDGFDITALPWKHRDINLVKALSKAVFQGNATQLSWAFHSATQAPFYAPYTGFHITLASGLSILNYNEGFNSKMSDADIEALARRFKTDVLLAGMQLDFVDDVVRGVAALKPRVVILYPPHEHFHAMMGVRSTPWSQFKRAIEMRLPGQVVLIAEPGFRFSLGALETSFALAAAG